MIEKYTYHGIDITLDVYEKIKSVAALISERENVSFEDACILFAQSPVYQAMQNMESLYWYESPEYLIEEYERKKSSTEPNGVHMTHCPCERFVINKSRET